MLDLGKQVGKQNSRIVINTDAFNSSARIVNSIRKFDFDPREFNTIVRSDGIHVSLRNGTGEDNEDMNFQIESVSNILDVANCTISVLGGSWVRDVNNETNLMSVGDGTYNSNVSVTPVFVANVFVPQNITLEMKSNVVTLIPETIEIKAYDASNTEPSPSPGPYLWPYPVTEIDDNYRWDRFVIGEISNTGTITQFFHGDYKDILPVEENHFDITSVGNVLDEANCVIKVHGGSWIREIDGETYFSNVSDGRLNPVVEIAPTFIAGSLVPNYLFLEMATNTGGIPTGLEIKAQSTSDPFPTTEVFPDGHRYDRFVIGRVEDDGTIEQYYHGDVKDILGETSEEMPFDITVTSNTTANVNGGNWTYNKENDSTLMTVGAATIAISTVVDTYIYVEVLVPVDTDTPTTITILGDGGYKQSETDSPGNRYERFTIGVVHPDGTVEQYYHGDIKSFFILMDAKYNDSHYKSIGTSDIFRYELYNFKAGTAAAGVCEETRFVVRDSSADPVTIGYMDTTSMITYINECVPIEAANSSNFANFANSAAIANFSEYSNTANYAEFANSANSTNYSNFAGSIIGYSNSHHDLADLTDGDDHPQYWANTDVRNPDDADYATNGIVDSGTFRIEGTETNNNWNSSTFKVDNLSVDLHSSSGIIIDSDTSLDLVGGASVGIDSDAFIQLTAGTYIVSNSTTTTDLLATTTMTIRSILDTIIDAGSNLDVSADTFITIVANTNLDMGASTGDVNVSSTSADLNLNAGAVVNLSSGSDMNLNVSTNFLSNIVGTSNTHSGGTMSINTDANLDVVAGTDLDITALTGILTIMSGGNDINLDSATDINLNADADIVLVATSNISLQTITGSGSFTLSGSTATLNNDFIATGNIDGVGITASANVNAVDIIASGDFYQSTNQGLTMVSNVNLVADDGTLLPCFIRGGILCVS